MANQNMRWDPRTQQYVFGSPTVSGGAFDYYMAGADPVYAGSDDVESGAEEYFETGAASVLFSGSDPVYAGSSIEAGFAPVLLSGAEDPEAAMAALAAQASGAEPYYVDAGALRRPMMRPRPGQRVVVARPAPRPMAAPAQRKVNMVERKCNLNFVGLNFAIGEIRPLTERPQVRNWQGYQLVVPPNFADDFLVTAIQVEQRNAFANSQPAPASAFTSTEDEPNIDMPVNTNGMDVILSIQNISGIAGKNFRCVIRGKVVTASKLY
jgi:hypothetical protein